MLLARCAFIIGARQARAAAAKDSFAIIVICASKIPKSHHDADDDERPRHALRARAPILSPISTRRRAAERHLPCRRKILPPPLAQQMTLPLFRWLLSRSSAAFFRCALTPARACRRCFYDASSVASATRSARKRHARRRSQRRHPRYTFIGCYLLSFRQQIVREFHVRLSLRRHCSNMPGPRWLGV